MATAKQFTANRQNAKKSTGPKTAIGKAHTAKNALRHGVYTALPVIPTFERRIDWETHRDGIFKSLTPIGALEEVLAARVAFCCWRLARLQRYETGMTVVRLEDIDARLQPIDASILTTFEPEDDVWEEALDETQNIYDAPEPILQRAVKRLKQQQDTLETWAGTLQLLIDLQTLPENVQVHGDDVYGVWQDCLDALAEDDDVPDIEGTDFLTQVGVPEEYLDDAYTWNDWTVSMVHRGMTLLAAAGGITPAYLLTKALRARRQTQETTQTEIKRLTATIQVLQQRVYAKASRMKQERMLPDADTIQKVVRYEAHLSRQLFQTLHELQRLQAARSGQIIPLPAALDVVVSGAESDDA